MARARRQTHRERLRDRDTEDAPPRVLGRQRAALHGGVRDRLEALGRAFPQDLALPAQLAADESGGEAVHDEPRHLQLPAMDQRERAPFARRARDVADLRIPVVAVLVDEPEAQPYRIGKVDPAHAPRQRRAVVDAVGGKGEGLPGKRLAPPAALPRGVAASLRRIFGVELGGHEAKRRGRQRGLERAARAVDEKDVVPLLDARRREPCLCEHAQHHRRHRAEPPRAPARDDPRDDDNGGDDQKPVTKQIVDGEPERRHHQHERGKLEPGLIFGARRGSTAGGACGGQCSRLSWGEPYRSWLSH